MTALPAEFGVPWWKAALIRAVRTAIVIAIPYVPASYSGATPYVTIASAAGLGFVLSILTSLAGIAEAQGVQVAWYFAIVERVVKTVAQALIAAIGNAVLFQDVAWNAVLPVIAAAAFGSLLLGVLKDLPEAPTPLAHPEQSIALGTKTGSIQLVKVVDEGVNLNNVTFKHPTLGDASVRPTREDF